MSTTLKALFRLGGPGYGGDVADYAIAEVTGGPEIHVEALIGDDPLTCFSAHLLTGVRMVGYLGGYPQRWYGLDTGVEVTQEALDWAKDECGQPYDLLAAIISGFKCADSRNLQPLFCSQAFAQFYKRCGGVLGLERPNPHVLAEYLILLGATRIESLPSGLFVPGNRAQARA